MNTGLLILSLFYIGVGLIFGVVILFLCFKFISFWMRKRYGLKEYNTSLSILVGSILFSVGYFMKSAVGPVIDTFRTLMREDEQLFTIIVKCGGYMLLYFLISSVFSFIVITVSIFLFTLFTRNIKEMEEIKNNNIGIGIILGVVIIVLSLLVGDGFIQLTESIIPFPSLPKKISF